MYNHEVSDIILPPPCVTICHKSRDVLMKSENFMSCFRFTHFQLMFAREMMIAGILLAYAGINPTYNTYTICTNIWQHIIFLRTGICTCRPGYVEWKWECHPMSGLGESCITTAQCVSQVVSIVSKCIKFVVNHCENCTGKWSQPCV